MANASAAIDACTRESNVRWLLSQAASNGLEEKSIEMLRCFLQRRLSHVQ